MKSKSFATKVEVFHRRWLSNILDLNISTCGGIDLFNDRIGVETKCRYEIWTHTFTVHHYQIALFEQQNPGKELFWAFLLYGLEKKPKKIRRKNIETIISGREVWFYPWDWVKQFKVYWPTTGPYVYVKARYFSDEGYNTFGREGGILHVPKGSILEKMLF